MAIRTAKLLLVCAIALIYTFIVFTNLTDFDTNYQFVRHVLMMDTTFPASHTHGRAITSPAIHMAFYIGILAWEAASTVLLWWGAVRLARNLRAPAAAFNTIKRLAIIALTVSALLWLIAFLCIGGEWFLMWQSPTWNGQQEAFRMFAIISIVLLFIAQPDTDTQP